MKSSLPFVVTDLSEVPLQFHVLLLRLDELLLGCTEIFFQLTDFTRQLLKQSQTTVHANISHKAFRCSLMTDKRTRIVNHTSTLSDTCPILFQNFW